MISDITAPNLSRYAWGLAIAWTLVISGLLVWDVSQDRVVTEAFATAQARTHFNKDVAFRMWATKQGRIYIPESESYSPDPSMAHIPERDIETASGMKLSLVNPAYIVRQLNEEFGHLYKVPGGRIVGLRPLRAENAPDAWERKALERFELGDREVFEYTEIEGAPYLRLMRPLWMSAGCLFCHGIQGFEAGDLAGGVGVSFPMSSLLAREYQARNYAFFSYGLVWLLGLAGIGTVFRHLRRKEDERQNMVNALSASEARKGAILDSALDCIISVDRDDRITEFNPAAEKTFGYSREQIIGQNLKELLIHPDLQEKPSKGFEHHLHGGESHLLNSRVETKGMRSDGGEFPLELAITRVDIDGEPLFTAYLRDITESKNMAEQLSYQASHDSLTGLVNRREFEKRLKQVLETARPQQVEHTLFYIDLDQFKVVNDTCGHTAGDELLRQLGSMLHSQVRAGDTLARLGGDEFGVLLENCPLKNAAELGGVLLESVKAFRFLWEGKTFVIGASIGIVPITGVGETLIDILSAADSACYAAKDRGGNRMQIFNADDVDFARLKGEMSCVSRIHDALENNRFCLYAQTLAPLAGAGASGREHYELLIRLKDEHGGFISPGAFLPAAERYNLISAIDRWVVSAALGWLHDNPAKLSRLEMCSINLSGHSVTDEHFLEFVIDELAKYRIPPESICFEITETAAVSNLAKASQFIEALKKQGCRFALDDFGSGMSSFAYLKNLPVDYLKIDGTFVRDIVDDEIDFAMVKSINDIGHVMGKQTIAEFVENDAILEKLRTIGVDYAQGYGIAVPRPISADIPVADRLSG